MPLCIIKKNINDVLRVKEFTISSMHELYILIIGYVKKQKKLLYFNFVNSCKLEAICTLDKNVVI